jgi:probable phosphoglycerate mutase
VLLVRYLAERLSEAELIAVARATSIANCSISSWRRSGGQLRPERFNYVDHLHRMSTARTRQQNINADHA